MTDRIQIKYQDNKIEITIKALKDSSKQKMLLGWIVLFSVCGLVIISQFFYDYDKSSKLFFAVYLAFWIFFEFKVIYAYRWRNAGIERITIDSKQIEFVKEIGKRGMTQIVELDELNNLRLFEPEEPGFVKTMNSSYWNINKYTLAFDYQNKPFPFAIDLDKNEAKKLLKEIGQFLAKIKKS
ncbi:MAG: hypothetical protein AB7O47_04985 [Flavobacteriales bacterium]